MKIDTYSGLSGSPVKFSILDVNVSFGCPDISKLQRSYINTLIFL